MALEPVALDPAALEDFAEAFGDLPWFTRLGETPTPAERALADDYFARFGRPKTIAVWLHDLQAAEEVMQRAGVSDAWDRAERALAASLSAALEARLGRVAAAETLNRLMLAASDAAMAGAREVFPRHKRDNAALMRVAAGSGSRAAAEYALALLADPAPQDHPFAAKWRLFAAGRWPLIAVEDQFALL